MGTTTATPPGRAPAGLGIACAWCGNWLAAPTAPLAECPLCGSASTYPPPSAQELARAYASWYRPSGGRFSLGAEQILRHSRSRLARRLDRLAPDGPILDVGCGEGTLVAALHARGREALGLEREAAPPDVLAREVTDFDERLGEWAAVVFWHSLEHLPDAPAALDRAAALLQPGGLCVLAVPNYGSWQRRLLGRRWLHLDLPMHIVHIPAAGLVEGLRRRELRVTRISHWRAGQIVFGWVHGLVSLLPGRPDLYAAIRRPAAQREQMRPAVRLQALAAGTLLLPLALVLSAAEVALGAAGSVYVEAVRQ